MQNNTLAPWGLLDLDRISFPAVSLVVFHPTVLSLVKKRRVQRRRRSLRRRVRLLSRQRKKLLKRKKLKAQQSRKLNQMTKKQNQPVKIQLKVVAQKTN